MPDIDWKAFAETIAPVEVIDEPVLVKKRSRDFFWFSPLLNEKLKRKFGDLVALPANRAEMAQVLRAAHAAEVPVVLRGGGTGNYGQAVPLEGGLIIETTKMNRILEIGDGFVRVETGALMEDINTALMEQGWEMAMFPSTQDIATVGGFVAGGSAGIGSLGNGVLRDPGNLISVTVMSVTDDPQEHVFEGPDTMLVHHTWGLNGVITEVTLRTVPTRDWVGCMATFDSYRDAYAAGWALANAEATGRKLASAVDARIVDYFPRLKGHLRAGKHLVVTYVPAEHVGAFRDLAEAHGGHMDLALSDEDRKARNLPHVFEFCYNHTTLQVLKADRSATFQQISVPDPNDIDAVIDLAEKLGDDVWQHHEFARLNDEIVCFLLPVIWFRDEARLREIDRICEDNGFQVYDAHVHYLEGGSVKADYRHLALKKRLDPKGLLNSAKSTTWAKIKHLSPEQIEAMATA